MYAIINLEANVMGGITPYTYLWNTQSVNSVITPTSNGTYWVIVTDDILCESDTAFFEVTDLVTDIADIIISNLSIYPNPTSGLINIDFKVIGPINFEVRIINIIGERLFFDNLKSFEGEYSMSLDLSNFSKGIYFLEIETNDGVINKKLILQ